MPDAAVSPRAGETPSAAWRDGLFEAIDFAFQPLVNMQTGTCYGVEALLRGHDRLGFSAIHDLFDAACRDGVLHQTETALKEIAFRKFARLNLGRPVRLFLNLDNRVLNSPDYRGGQTAALAEKFGLSPHSICLELSERHELSQDGNTVALLETYRRQSFRLAIDDFGTGYAGLKLLYDRHPDFVKIDRYFISGIPDDGKKKLVVSNIVALAHVLGITVVAEGVETEREFLTCKEIGCDLVQGFLVQRPQTDLAELRGQYEGIVALNTRDRRRPDTDARIIYGQIETLPPLTISAPMNDVFDRFRRDKAFTFFPVTDEAGQPLGLVREENLKDYIYSQYGKELIFNKAFGLSLRDFVTACPVADIGTEAEKILEAFTLNENAEGIIITDNFRYVGFLSASSLLRVINEKNLTTARDQNPLSKLPGNNMIAEYTSEALHDVRTPFTVAYFDFDNFKPLNDHYGYRQGDRAIVLFAELLRKNLTAPGNFLGHVGGDDFFVGLANASPEHAEASLRLLAERFASQVESFYDVAERTARGIHGKDRDGNEKFFPLLTVSAAVIHLPQDRPACTLDMLTGILAKMKKQAKREGGGLAVATLSCICASAS